MENFNNFRGIPHPMRSVGWGWIAGRAGEFRLSQNWIGPTGCTLGTAYYVPPNVDDMKQALEDLEAFFYRETPELDPVVKAALIHYQFETIHLFWLVRALHGQIRRR